MVLILTVGMVTSHTCKRAGLGRTITLPLSVGCDSSLGRVCLVAKRVLPARLPPQNAEALTLTT